MTEITKLTETTFQNEVLEAEELVLVDFTAVWCAPCKMLDPVVKDLASDWAGKIKVFKLDVDETPGVAINYNIMGVPTLMLFSHGEVKERLTGYQPKKKIVNKLSAHL
jgi:thioredoxin 1